MTVITISRQYYSGGNQIATHLCQRFNYRLFDKNLMARLATEAGLSLSELVDFSEERYQVQSLADRIKSIWGWERTVARVGTWQVTATGAEFEQVEPLNERESIAFTQSSIQAAYRLDNVVIVGRGGQALLRDMPNVLHVRIEAPLPFRVERLQKTENLSNGVAMERIGWRDRAAEEYLRRFYQITWDDSSNYHLVLNTERWGIETATQLIEQATKHLQSQPAPLTT